MFARVTAALCALGAIVVVHVCVPLTRALLQCRRSVFAGRPVDAVAWPRVAPMRKTQGGCAYACSHSHALCDCRGVMAVCVGRRRFVQGGGCDPYFQVRVTTKDEPDPAQKGFWAKKVYDYREHVKKVRCTRARL